MFDFIWAEYKANLGTNPNTAASLDLGPIPGKQHRIFGYFANNNTGPYALVIECFYIGRRVSNTFMTVGSPGIAITSPSTVFATDTPVVGSVSVSLTAMGGPTIPGLLSDEHSPVLLQPWYVMRPIDRITIRGQSLTTSPYRVWLGCISES